MWLKGEVREYDPKRLRMHESSRTRTIVYREQRNAIRSVPRIKRQATIASRSLEASNAAKFMWATLSSYGGVLYNNMQIIVPYQWCSHMYIIIA